MLPQAPPQSRRAVLKLVAGALCLPALSLPGLTTRAADPAPLATFTDPEGRFTLQYPADWQVQDVPPDASGILQGAMLHLQGPGVSVIYYRFDAALTLDGQIDYFRGRNATDDQYLHTFEDPAVGQVGGEPARTMRYQYVEQANPDNIGVLTTWFVDHGGARYQFRLDDDYDRHRAVLDTLIASVTFAPVPLADFADPESRITFQYPQYWNASRQTEGNGAVSNIVHLEAESLSVYVNALGRFDTLDDAITEYRAGYASVNGQNDIAFDPPRTVLIGGKLGQSVAVTTTTKDHPEYAPYSRTTYFVDHAGQRFRFETGNFNGAHANELLAMMQSVTLLPQPFAVYTDEAHAVSFQYPKAWTVSHLMAPDAPRTNVVLDAKGVHLTFIADRPNVPLENDVQFFLDEAKKNPAYTAVTDEARADDQVGNEPARTLTFRYHVSGDAEGVFGVKRIWFVDHGGVRYIFQCSDYRVSSPEINDVIASVAFAPTPKTTFTDPKGRITLQYPSAWVASGSGSGNNLFRATLKYGDVGGYADLNVFAFRPALPSLDAELTQYTQRQPANTPDIVYAFDDAPQSTRIGGEPARSLGIASRQKGDESHSPARATIWVVDHAEYRYVFIFADTDIHGKEMIAVLDSVRFLM